MKLSLAVFGLLITIQSICSAPVDIEESITDSQLRVFMNSILSGTPVMPGQDMLTFFNNFAGTGGNLFSNPLGTFGSGTVQEALAPFVNGLSSVGGNIGNIPNNVLGTFSPLFGRNDHATNVEREEELVDIINALVQHMNSEGHTRVAVDQNVHGSIVSHDAIVQNENEDSVEETPLYVLID